MPSNTSRPPQRTSAGQTPGRQAMTKPSAPQRHEKTVPGIVVARRVLRPEERAQAAAVAVAPASRQGQQAAPGPPAAQLRPVRAASLAGSSSSSNSRMALAVLKKLARAVATRICPVCGQPVTAKALKLEVGPVYVEIHPGCADPVRRAQKAVDWLNGLLR